MLWRKEEGSAREVGEKEKGEYRMKEERREKEERKARRWRRRGETRKEEKGIGKEREKDIIHSLDPNDQSLYILFKMKHMNKATQGYFDTHISNS